MPFSFEILFVTALLLDWLLGDPRWLPHPVRGIGLLCTRLERTLRGCFSSAKMAGVFTTLAVLLITTTATWVSLKLAGYLSVHIQNLLAVLILYLFVALKDLLRHSRDVFDALQNDNNLTEARQAIAMIVGRDTEHLNEEEICKACVETVSENLVDGITAPLFWAIVFSFLSPLLNVSPISCAAIGIALYKAINTMDSMFGYTNEKYIQFGWSAARLDDLANFIPARISALLIIPIALIARFDWRGCFSVLCRDRLKHSSPNAGHTEAAVAGALGIQLGGPTSYFGKKLDKFYLGDPLHQTIPQHIIDANRIVVYTTLLLVSLLLVLRRALFILM